MSRLQAALAARKDGRGGIIPYITAGDPDPDSTVALIVSLAQAGASAVEVGVPFSDPIADGPVIQRACRRALRYRLGVSDVLRIIAQARRRTDVPIVLFSYCNPLLCFGLERLAREAARADVDGVLVTDLPAEEAEPLAASLAVAQLDPIFLVAPTSTDARLRLAAARARGFIYAVSRAGTTGMDARLSGEAEQLVTRLRPLTPLPIAVGFGVASAQQVAAVWRFAEAAVVGSALVLAIEQHAADPHMPERIGALLRSLVPGHAEG